MNDLSRMNKELIEEISFLKQRVHELEKSKLKRVEEALTQSEAKYRNLVEQAWDAIFVVDPQGKIVLVNRQACQMLGYAQEELLQMNIADTYTVEQKAFVQQRIATAQNCSRMQYERSMMRKDGTTIPTDITIGMLPNGLIQGIARDITERKRADEALRESDRKYRELVENANSIILRWNRDGEITFMNEFGLRFFGYAEKDLLGRHVVGTIVPENESTGRDLRPLMDRVTANPKDYGQNINENVRSNGERVWISWTNKAILDQQGQIREVLSIGSDITERQQAEKKLQNTLESLRKAVGATIQVMVAAVEARDPYTAGHQIRSADLSRAIATEMVLPQEKIDGIRMAASIHDIGKLSIPAEILAKPTKLSGIELSLIREHAKKGYEMLKNVESSWPLAEIVYQHHERMNGSGYPRGLKENEILIEARILAVADVVEAMASHRPYRPGLGIAAALNEIEKNRGIFYDITVADACSKLFREKGFQLQGPD